MTWFSVAGCEIKHARERMRLTQEECAKKVGITTVTLRAYECSGVDGHDPKWVQLHIESVSGLQQLQAGHVIARRDHRETLPALLKALALPPARVLSPRSDDRISQPPHSSEPRLESQPTDWRNSRIELFAFEAGATGSRYENAFSEILREQLDAIEADESLFVDIMAHDGARIYRPVTEIMSRHGRRPLHGSRRVVVRVTVRVQNHALSHGFVTSLLTEQEVIGSWELRILTEAPPFQGNAMGRCRRAGGDEGPQGYAAAFLGFAECRALAVRATAPYMLWRRGTSLVADMLLEQYRQWFAHAWGVARLDYRLVWDDAAKQCRLVTHDNAPSRA